MHNTLRSGFFAIFSSIYETLQPPTLLALVVLISLFSYNCQTIRYFFGRKFSDPSNCKFQFQGNPIYLNYKLQIQLHVTLIRQANESEKKLYSAMLFDLFKL